MGSYEQTKLNFLDLTDREVKQCLLALSFAADNHNNQYAKEAFHSVRHKLLEKSDDQ